MIMTGKKQDCPTEDMIVDLGFVRCKVKGKTTPQQGVLFVQDNRNRSFRELPPGAVVWPPRRLLIFKDTRRLSLMMVRSARFQLVVDLDETILHRTLITPRYKLDICVEVTDPVRLLRRNEKSALTLFVKNIREVKRCVDKVRVGSDLAGEPLMRYLNNSRFISSHGLKIISIQVTTTDHSANPYFATANKELEVVRPTFLKYSRKKLERMVASDIRKIPELSCHDLESRIFRMNYMAVSVAGMITNDIRNGCLTTAGLAIYLDAVRGLSFETIRYAVEITGENDAYVEAFTKAYNRTYALKNAKTSPNRK